MPSRRCRPRKCSGAMKRCWNGRDSRRRPAHGRDRRMKLRPAEQADAEAIAVAEAETAGTPGLLIGQPGEIPPDAYRTKIAKLATQGRYIVAEQEGVLVG